MSGVHEPSMSITLATGGAADAGYENQPKLPKQNRARGACLGALFPRERP